MEALSCDQGGLVLSLPPDLRRLAHQASNLAAHLLFALELERLIVHSRHGIDEQISGLGRWKVPPSELVS